jgi:hypothetical protein
MRLGLGVSIPGTSSPVQAAFSPLDLSPVLWLDASDTSTITEVGGAVSQWDDKSGNGNNVTQGTAAAQPTTGTRTLNSLNVLDFDGNDSLNAGNKFDVLTGGLTIMVVAAFDNASGNGGLVSKNITTNNGDYGLIRQGSNDKMTALLRGNSASLAEQSTVFSSTSATIHGYRLRRDTTDGLQLWQNGAFVASQNTSGTTSFTSSNDFFVGVGAATNLNMLDGFIAEIVVVQSGITDTEMADLDEYLRNKWAVY